MLRYWTAGESHGRGLMALVDGFPSGVEIDTDLIDRELARRQGGYGRGGRQKLETDTVEILSGVWHGHSIGSPIALWVVNSDYKIETMEDIDRPRPGHGDLSGSMKYLAPVRHILERSSARETAAKVAAGALGRQLLEAFGIETIAYVREIGPLQAIPDESLFEQEVSKLREIRDRSELYTLLPERDDEFKALIDDCRHKGDTLGGIIEIRVTGAPFGLGTHAQWDQKLDGKLAQAVMAIQAIKGVEIGLGFETARRRGSEVHDPIQFDRSQVDSKTLGYVRPTNNAGGLEAGMTNGQPIVIRAAKKPIATLGTPLESINFSSKETEEAAYERSDICAIAAASVVLENIVAMTIAIALVDKFGGDSLEEMLQRLDLFQQLARKK